MLPFRLVPGHTHTHTDPSVEIAKICLELSLCERPLQEPFLLEFLLEKNSKRQPVRESRFSDEHCLRWFSLTVDWSPRALAVMLLDR